MINNPVEQRETCEDNPTHIRAFTEFLSTLNNRTCSPLLRISAESRNKVYAYAVDTLEVFMTAPWARAAVIDSVPLLLSYRQIPKEAAYLKTRCTNLRIRGALWWTGLRKLPLARLSAIQTISFSGNYGPLDVVRAVTGSRRDARVASRLCPTSEAGREMSLPSPETVYLETSVYLGYELEEVVV